MKKIMFTLLVVFGLTVGVKAEGEIKWKRASPADDGFLTTKMATSNLIPVDVDKEYIVSGEFLSNKPIGQFLFFCLAPYDKDKKKIQRYNVSNIPGTDMTLTAACKSGATTITIKDGAKWKAVFDKISRKPYIVFDVDHEGTFKDLPNSNISKMKKIENVDGSWKVELSTPCIKDYPTGTKLRLHRSNSGMMYVALVQVKNFPIGTVKKISATISGERLSGVGKGNKDEAFWKGTKYVQFFIMVLKNKVLFKNISIKESE